MKEKIGTAIFTIGTIAYSIFLIVVTWMAFKDFLVKHLGHLPFGPDWLWNIIFFFFNALVIGLLTGILNYSTTKYYYD